MTILASPNSSAVNLSHPLNRGLVGWWLPGFGGRTGQVLRDLSGNHTHGTLTNMASDDWIPATGRPGGFGALNFDGSNDHVLNSSPSSLLNGMTGLTISFWWR